MTGLDEARAEAEDENNLLEVEILKLFLSDAFHGTDAPPPPRHRIRYARALQGIAEFLEKVGASGEVVADVRTLVDGLNELDRGVVVPFLQPRKKKGKAFESDEVARAKMHLVLALHLFHRSGLTIAEAADEVAKAPLRKGLHARLTPGKSKSLRSSVESWHKQLSLSGKKSKWKNRVIATEYDAARGVIAAKIAEEQLDPAIIRQWARRILNNHLLHGTAHLADDAKGEFPPL